MKQIAVIFIAIFLMVGLICLTQCDTQQPDPTVSTTQPEYLLVDPDELVNLLLAQDPTSANYKNIMIEMTAEYSGYSEDNTIIYLKGTGDEIEFPFECHATKDEHLAFFANPDFVVGEFVTIQGAIIKVYTDDANGWMYVINIHSIGLVEQGAE